MLIFDSYTHRTLSELNKNKVDYLVVGGYAVNFHGFRRTTGDIDLWIRPENGSNKEKIIQSLKNLGVETDVLAELYNLDFTQPLVFVDGEAPYKIDFMTHVSGITFNDAWHQKINASLDGLQIPFIHLAGLILSKIATERAQDRMDVEELQKIQQLKSKK